MRVGDGVVCSLHHDGTSPLDFPLPSRSATAAPPDDDDDDDIASLDIIDIDGREKRRGRERRESTDKYLDIASIAHLDTSLIIRYLSSSSSSSTEVVVVSIGQTTIATIDPF